MQACRPMLSILHPQEKMRRMTPQQRQKYEEKKKAVMAKRQMKMKMVK